MGTETIIAGGAALVVGAVVGWLIARMIKTKRAAEEATEAQQQAKFGPS